MAYSLDLRQRAVDRVKQGNSAAATTKLFQVSSATIYRWLQRSSLERTIMKQRRRKNDLDALRKQVRDNPEARLQDRAQVFGVHQSAMDDDLDILGALVVGLKTQAR